LLQEAVVIAARCTAQEREATVAAFRALSKRHRQAELLDEANLNAAEHASALVGLERINWLSGSAGILWPEVRRIAGTLGSRPVNVLDVATGAGDVPIRLWKKAQTSGILLHVTGCDRSPQSIAYAQGRARESQASVEFRICDVLREALPGEYDIVVSSLFLHHLGEEEAIGLLEKMARSARHCVLINDLVRSVTGYVLAYVGTRLLSSSTIVRVDGPISVQSAFTLAEVRQMASQAGLHGASVARRWPCRYLLVWRRRGNLP
jgi:2-polyprenyl-3-methyl-5-hydroxy-6-metoxy-1,4-benzoquinol methylase